jgi:hypothetical protein
VLLADVVIHAIDAALEDRKVTLNRIRMRIAANIFADGVNDRRVTGEFLANLPIDTTLICPEMGVLGDRIVFQILRATPANGSGPAIAAAAAKGPVYAPAGADPVPAPSAVAGQYGPVAAEVEVLPPRARIWTHAIGRAHGSAGAGNPKPSRDRVPCRAAPLSSAGCSTCVAPK